VDWSTLGCGRYGHTTFAPDEPELRAQLSAAIAAGEAWRCLRCGAFVAGPPDATGPAAQAPLVLRGSEIRSKLILRLFAIERFVRVLIFATASYFLWRFSGSHSSIERAFNREVPALRAMFRELGFNINHSGLVGLLRHALTLSGHTITLLAIGATAYAAIEVVEGVGLWQARRWGEYFAFVATSLGLPLETYDLTRRVTWLALVLLAVNLALVLYLAITRRLFGIRGGRRAYDARLREESVMEEAIRAASRAPMRPGSSTDVDLDNRELPADRGHGAATPVVHPATADGYTADATAHPATADGYTADATDRPAPANRRPGGR
jgi:uncharacterized membrane protein (DUF2068 family)